MRAMLFWVSRTSNSSNGYGSTKSSGRACIQFLITDPTTLAASVNERTKNRVQFLKDKTHNEILLDLYRVGNSRLVVVKGKDEITRIVMMHSSPSWRWQKVVDQQRESDSAAEPIPRVSLRSGRSPIEGDDSNSQARARL